MSENGAKSLRKVKQTFMMITAPDVQQSKMDVKAAWVEKQIL